MGKIKDRIFSAKCKKSLLDFVRDCQEDQQLAQEYLNITDPHRLYLFFEKDYDISLAECVRIIKYKQNWTTYNGPPVGY